MAERKYFAISIKHSIHWWKFGMPLVLWGWHKTTDDEPRCYGGYTEYPYDAELYSIEEFQKHYKDSSTFKYDTPVHMELAMCRKYKNYDTVFIEADKYIGYCKMACLPLRKETDNE